MLPHFGDTDDHVTGVTLWPCEANTFSSFPIAMWKHSFRVQNLIRRSGHDGVQETDRGCDERSIGKMTNEDIALFQTILLVIGYCSAAR